MKRKNLASKFLWTKTLILLPFVLLSCGGGESGKAAAPSIDNSYFLVANPYKPNTSFYFAVKDIVDSYNKFIVQQNKLLPAGAPKFVPAKQVEFGTNYHTTRSRVISLLETGVIEDVPSVTWGHGDLISAVTPYNRQMSFNDIPVSQIVPAFRDIDSKAQGVRTVERWSLQTGFSARSTGINTPILAYIVRNFLRAGAKISEDVEQTKFFEDVLQVGAFDEPVVRKRYGALTQDPAVLERVKSYVFDTKEWESLVGLFEFGALVKDAFPELKDYILGMEEFTNIVVGLLYSAAQHREEGMAWKLADTPEGFKFDLSSLFNPNSVSSQTLRRIFNMFKEMIIKRVVWVPKKENSYSSSFFKEHRILFTVTKTSGWDFSYVTDRKFAIKQGEQLLTPKKFLFKDIRTNLESLEHLQLKNTGLLMYEDILPKQIGFFVDGSSEIKRVWEGVGPEGLTPPAGAQPKDIVVTPATAEKLQELFNQQPDATPHDNFVVLDKANHPVFAEKTKVSGFVYSDGVGTLYSDEVFLLEKDVVPFGSEQTLQPWEIRSLSLPNKLDKNSQYKTIVITGPVVVGIKTSPERDYNALNFVKFYASQQGWARYRGEQLVEPRVLFTPSDYFALSAGYLPSTTELLLQKPVHESKRSNFFYVASFHALRTAAGGIDPYYAVYRWPAEKSGLFFALGQAISRAEEPNYNFENFLSDVKQTVQGDSVLMG